MQNTVTQSISFLMTSYLAYFFLFSSWHCITVFFVDHRFYVNSEHLFPSVTLTQTRCFVRKFSSVHMLSVNKHLLHAWISLNRPKQTNLNINSHMSHCLVILTNTNPNQWLSKYSFKHLYFVSPADLIKHSEKIYLFHLMNQNLIMRLFLWIMLYMNYSLFLQIFGNAHVK